MGYNGLPSQITSPNIYFGPVSRISSISAFRSARFRRITWEEYSAPRYPRFRALVLHFLFRFLVFDLIQHIPDFQREKRRPVV